MTRIQALNDSRGPAMALLTLLLVAMGCGGGGGSPTEPPMPDTGQNVAVTFTYRAPIAVDPAVDYLTCTPQQVVFRTHLHFIWNFWEDRRQMLPAGTDRFELRSVVPADRDLRIALHDPNNCLDGDVYVAPTTLSVNGVFLTRVVPVQQGTGLAFRVERDGTVIP